MGKSIELKIGGNRFDLPLPDEADILMIREPQQSSHPSRLCGRRKGCPACRTAAWGAGGRGGGGQDPAVRV